MCMFQEQMTLENKKYRIHLWWPQTAHKNTETQQQQNIQRELHFAIELDHSKLKSNINIHCHIFVLAFHVIFDAKIIVLDVARAFVQSDIVVESSMALHSAIMKNKINTENNRQTERSTKTSH